MQQNILKTDKNLNFGIVKTKKKKTLKFLSEDCDRVIDLQYTNDEINCSDYVEESENPHNNDCDDEFEDGYGDEELDTIKVEVFDDADRKNLIDTVDL